MSDVTVASDVLTSQGEGCFNEESGALVGWEQDPHFLVTALDGNHQTLLAGVWAAHTRFHTIDENGDELSDWEMDGQTYTPNFVFDPVLLPKGLALIADTKGFLPEPMGVTMVRVLVEELSSRNLAAHLSCLPDDADLEAAERAPVCEDALDDEADEVVEPSPMY